MRIQALQAPTLQKLKRNPDAIKWCGFCTGIRGEMKQSEFAGLVYILEKEGMKNYQFFYEDDAREARSLSKWQVNNQATTNVMPRERCPSPLSQWRKSQPEWERAKQLATIFFNGTFEEYRKYFSEKELIDCAKELKIEIEQMKVEMVLEELKKQFQATQKEAKGRLDKQVANWKKNPRHQEVPNKEVEDHKISVIADMLFMTGRVAGEGQKYQMLYPNLLNEEKEHLAVCAKLLGYFGNNYEHVQIAFEGAIIEVYDGIFTPPYRQGESEGQSVSSSPIEDKAAPINASIAKRSRSESPPPSRPLSSSHKGSGSRKNVSGDKRSEESTSGSKRNSALGSLGVFSQNDQSPRITSTPQIDIPLSRDQSRKTPTPQIEIPPRMSPPRLDSPTHKRGSPSEAEFLEMVLNSNVGAVFAQKVLERPEEAEKVGRGVASFVKGLSALAPMMGLLPEEPGASRRPDSDSDQDRSDHSSGSSPSTDQGGGKGLSSHSSSPSSSPPSSPSNGSQSPQLSAPEQDVEDKASVSEASASNAIVEQSELDMLPYGSSGKQEKTSFSSDDASRLAQFSALKNNKVSVHGIKSKLGEEIKPVNLLPMGRGAPKISSETISMFNNGHSANVSKPSDVKSSKQYDDSNETSQNDAGQNKIVSAQA